MAAMVGPGGWRVEPVLVQRTLSRPPKPYLRVRHGPYWVPWRMSPPMSI